MKTIVPDYYCNFRCIADKCTHNCCVGWEIDVDAATLEFYRGVPGKLGDRLSESILQAQGVQAHFVLDDSERCPFLNEKNLCDIITCLGEDGLCQVCADHPRFRSFYSDRTEVGLGLCCEAAGRLILGNRNKVRLITEFDDGETAVPSEAEAAFFKKRAKAFDILQNRDNCVEARADEFLALYGAELPQKTASQWADAFLSLEQLDPERDRILGELKSLPQESLSECDLSGWSIAFEQLLMYFSYRQLADGLEDGLLKPRAALVALSYKMVKYLCAAHMLKHGSLTLDDIAEAARFYSSETEYSLENTEALLESLK